MALRAQKVSGAFLGLSRNVPLTGDLGMTLSHSASLQPDVPINKGEFNARCNPAMN